MSGSMQEGAASQAMPPGESVHEPGSLGQRLRKRREAMGLELPELAAQLKLKINIVEAIERDALDSLGAGVYTRGYLTAYAKAVGLPLVAVHAVPEARTTAPNLVTHVKPRYGSLFERYTSRLGHVFLTAAIVVPFVWMATSNQLPSHQATLTSLDVPAPDSFDGAERIGMQPQVDAPVMASLAPMFPPRSSPTVVDLPVPLAGVETGSPSVDPGDSGAAELVEDGAGPIDPIASALQLRLTADSWVEISDASGRVLESALLRAGSERRFPVSAGLSVSLGNAEGVELRLNGEAIDVSPYRRANVARFRLDPAGELQASPPRG
jgi:cytoskeleton protein RodZ